MMNTLQQLLNNRRYNKLQLMRDLSFNYQYTI
jgi:hypothetical protein